LIGARLGVQLPQGSTVELQPGVEGGVIVAEQAGDVIRVFALVDELVSLAATFEFLGTSWWVNSSSSMTVEFFFFLTCWSQ
jgi:hypothetical protein